MCNLYRMNASSAEVARLFGAHDHAAGSNHGSLVYPGYPGLVVAGGMVTQMSWGFPLVLNSKKTGEPLKPKPVNNARTDKLDSFMWKFSFEERRCLIPVSAFAEAEGEKGRMTRTWISVPGHELFACAGIWRNSDEWGPVYSMVMTDPGNPGA
jgi:putative SOS response-associated peptidase YedK